MQLPGNDSRRERHHHGAEPQNFFRRIDPHGHRGKQHLVGAGISRVLHRPRKHLTKEKRKMKTIIIIAMILFIGCASTIQQIPKDERMNSGLNISAKVSESNPWQVDKSIITYVEVTVTNDGNEKVATDVVCENGYYLIS